jgi:MFS family permease
MTTARFSARQGRLLLAGALMTFASSFGQNFFIAVFGGEIRAAFGLGHGAFGGLYALATLASAASLVWLGGMADRYPIRRLCALALLCLAASAAAMAGVASVWWVLAALFGLRLFGQGMLAHLSMTSMARWFEGGLRGRALGVAVLGNPVGEATLPMLALLAAGWIGWRWTWAAAAAFLVLAVLPAMLWLLRAEPPPEAAPRAAAPRTAAPEPAGRRHWTRREALADPAIYLLLPGLLAPSFINTSIFFHQAHLTEVKGWALAWFVACYPFGAAANVASSLGTGWAIDRWGAARVLPFFLLPMALGLGALAASADRLLVPVYMALAGASMGAMQPLLGSLAADLYGTRHLGSIRAMIVACLVLSSAVGPGLVGWVIDAGLDLGRQLAGMAAYTLAAAALLLVPRARLARAARDARAGD